MTKMTSITTAALGTFAMSIGLTILPLGDQARAFHEDPDTFHGTGQLHLFINGLDAQHDSHAADPNAHHVPTVDTNAETICASGEVLDGDGACVGIDTITPNSDALGDLEAICLEGEFIRRTAGGWECLDAAGMRLALERVKKVFVTSEVYFSFLDQEAQTIDPDFSGDGLMGADLICNHHAKLGGQSGVYTAWLSTSTVDARDRLTPNSGPFIRLDGVLVADDIADLTNGTIASPINVREDGTTTFVGLAWTGTEDDGTAQAAGNCGDWTTNVGLSAPGNLNATDSEWTAIGGATPTCNNAFNLYCFER